MSIRFGACVGKDTDKIAALKKAGFDYAEVSLSALAAMSDEEFETFSAKTAAIGMHVEATNGFFPAELRLVGADVDLNAITAYTEKAFNRAAWLGVRVCVLGSGKSRAIPEGLDRSTAEQQFVHVLRLCGDIAKKYGIIIAVEPLRTAECNFINTVRDGLEICARTAHPNVRCLADFYHVFMNSESLDAIAGAGEMLVHTHIARANPDRLYPHCEEDENACKQWAQALRDCGYSGRMSLEGGSGDDFAAMVEKAKTLLRIFRE